MSNTTPTVTDNVSIIASADLARGSISRGTIDLRAKIGAWLYPRVGRTGTAGLSDAVRAIARRMLDNTNIRHAPSHIWETQIAAASSTTVSTDAAAGALSFVVASATGFAADDVILLGGNTAREEWCRISKIDSNTIHLDSPLLFAHTAAQADPVRNKADNFQPIWLDGGAVWEVIFDYGKATAGDSVRVEAKAQTLDSLTNV